MGGSDTVFSFRKETKMKTSLQNDFNIKLNRLAEFQMHIFGFDW